MEVVVAEAAAGEEVVAVAEAAVGAVVVVRILLPPTIVSIANKAKAGPEATVIPSATLAGRAPSQHL